MLDRDRTYLCSVIIALLSLQKRTNLTHYFLFIFCPCLQVVDPLRDKPKTYKSDKRLTGANIIDGELQTV